MPSLIPLTSFRNPGHSSSEISHQRYQLSILTSIIIHLTVLFFEKMCHILSILRSLQMIRGAHHAWRKRFVFCNLKTSPKSSCSPAPPLPNHPLPCSSPGFLQSLSLLLELPTPIYPAVSYSVNLQAILKKRISSGKPISPLPNN